MNKKIWLLILSLCLVLCCTATAMAAEATTAAADKVNANCKHDKWKEMPQQDGTTIKFCTASDCDVYVVVNAEGKPGSERHHIESTKHDVANATGVCSVCNFKHTHTYNEEAKNGVCTGCTYHHTEHSYKYVDKTNCMCTDCFEAFEHNWNGENVWECPYCHACKHIVLPAMFKNGSCQHCQQPCDHPKTGWTAEDNDNCKCPKCNFVEKHSWKNGKCTKCDKADHVHKRVTDWSANSADKSTCTICGAVCTHAEYSSEDGKCKLCGIAECKHAFNSNGICSKCFMEHKHTYSNGKCTGCPKVHEHTDEYNNSLDNHDDDWKNGQCVVCHKAHDCKKAKQWDDTDVNDNVKVCKICEAKCAHKWEYDRTGEGPGTAGKSTCTVCGQECASDKHDWNVVVKSAGWCDTLHVQDWTCTKCNYTKTDTDYDHKYDSLYVEGTCTQFAKEVTNAAAGGRFCSRCNNPKPGTTYNEIKTTEDGKSTKKEHTWVIDTNRPGCYAPNCYNPGKAYMYCSVCTNKEPGGIVARIYNGAAEADIEIIGDALFKLQHSLKWTYKKADCTRSGRDVMACERCSYEDPMTAKYYENQPAIGHHTWYAVNKPATCVEGGKLYNKCSVCGNEGATLSTTDKLADEDKNHKWVDVQVLVEGDCYTNRIVSQKCSVRNCNKTRLFDKQPNHEYINGIDYVPATCKEPARGSKICTKCGTKMDAKYLAEIEPATELHSYKTITSPATCTEPEMTGELCIYCYQEMPGTEKVKLEGGQGKLGHSWNINYDAVDADGNKIYKEATCTQEGKAYVEGVCSRCFKSPYQAGLVKNEGDILVTGKKPHGDAKIVYYPADCTHAGTYKKVCSVCLEYVYEDVKTDEGAPATGHNYQWHTEPATCVSQGYTVKKCTKCNDILKETMKDVVAANSNHDFTNLKVLREANCKVSGLALQKCKKCSIKRVNTSPAVHNWSNDVEVITAATCGANGEGMRTCISCNKTEKYSIPATGKHDKKENYTWPADCENVAKFGTFCTVCGYNFNSDAIAVGTKPSGHAYVEVLDEKDAAGNLIYKKVTCTEDGRVWVECKYCHKVGKVNITPALGHDWGANEQYGTVTFQTCKTCGEHKIVNGEDQGSVCANFGHVLTVLAKKDPTCTETGLTEGQHCSVCNTDVVPQKVVAALGHTEVKVPGKAATCTETGMSDGVECSVCKATIKAQEVLEKKAHTYTKKFSFNADYTGSIVTYTCTECGDTYSEEKPF